LIDGKPATQLQGSKAGDNLQSISASEIERIEILTTPPAQFKAEGAAGAINIITRKRGAKEAASASLTGSLGNGGRWLVGGNGSYGGKHFTASLNAGFREDYRDRTIQSVVIGPDPTPPGQVLESREQAYQRIRRNIPSVGFSGEYDPNDRQSLAVSASWLSRGGLRTYTMGPPRAGDDYEPLGALTRERAPTVPIGSVSAEQLVRHPDALPRR
jgi:hypothetical protein